MLYRGLNASAGARRQSRRYRSPRRHFRHGQRAAVLRATTAAKLYLAGAVPSLAAAAEGCGSNIRNVRHVLALLKAEDVNLLNRARKGWTPLGEAAAAVLKRAELIRAYRSASPEDRIALARTVGAERLFVDAVEPAINN
jgi:hypothetical protein